MPPIQNHLGLDGYTALANIAQHLEGLHSRAPRRGSKWSISSVPDQLAQAVGQRLLLDRSMPSAEAAWRRGCSRSLDR